MKSLFCDNLWIKGMAYHKAGKFDMAIALFTKAINANENNNEDALLHHLYWSRSNVQKDLGNYELALSDLSEARRLCPDEWDAMIFDRIEIYKGMQEYNLAIADLTEVINEYTADYEAEKDFMVLKGLSIFYRDRGDLYIKNDCYDLAQHDYGKASEIEALYDHNQHISTLVKCLYSKNEKDIKKCLKEVNTKELEKMAVELYEKESDPEKEKTNEIINCLLYERSAKLNKHHIWKEESVKKLLKADKLLVSSFEKALAYAKSIRDEIENKSNNFVMDYEIEIRLIPYIREYKDDAIGNDFMFVICEPKGKQYKEVLTSSIHHANKYLEKNPLYNYNASCYFRDTEDKPLDCFKDNYISYAIFELLDTRLWSFTDIMNIDRVCAEVIINHQAFLGEYTE